MSYINQNESKYKYCLNKALLPKVSVYLSEYGFEYTRSQTWSMMLCPFHDDKNPSLSINLIVGCFKCFACGAKGGDLIAFHMKFRSMSFIDACKELGAWEKIK